MGWGEFREKHPAFTPLPPATPRVGEDTDRMLVDFLVWLGQRGVVTTTREMTTGRFHFGPGLIRAEDLIAEYWETYQ